MDRVIPTGAVPRRIPARVGEAMRVQDWDNATESGPHVARTLAAAEGVGG
jgi:hypothetical protein